MDVWAHCKPTVFIYENDILNRRVCTVNILVSLEQMISPMDGYVHCNPPSFIIELYPQWTGGCTVNQTVLLCMWFS
jgi:hypothetical protein